jgi:hypothetical protein
MNLPKHRARSQTFITSTIGRAGVDLSGDWVGSIRSLLNEFCIDSGFAIDVLRDAILAVWCLTIDQDREDDLERYRGQNNRVQH